MIIFSQTQTSDSLISTIAGQPFWVSFILVFAVLFLIYTLLEKMKVSLLSRLLAIIPVLLALAVFYFQDGPLMATVLLGTGFVLSFIMTFAQLIGK